MSVSTDNYDGGGATPSWEKLGLDVCETDNYDGGGRSRERY